MTSASRLFVWIGGGLFAISIAGFVAWYGLALATPRPWSGWLPVGVDALIFTGFALHHSLFARPSIKVHLERLVPERLLRSVYVWTASLLLLLVFVAWRPVGGLIYRASGWPAYALAAVQLTGVWLIARSVGAIDALELAGIHQARGTGALQVAGPYDFVRHPLYLGWMLAVFGAGDMTGDRLVFAAISSLYLIVAIPWEERSLEASFGAFYTSYKRRVRWRVVPYVY